MSPREIFALRDYLGPDLKGRTISDARQVVSLTDILAETCLAGRFDQLAGRSVLMSYPGWLWSYGINYSQREADLGRIYSGSAQALTLLDDPDFAISQHPMFTAWGRRP